MAKRHSFHGSHQGAASLGILNVKLHLADGIPAVAANASHRFEGSHTPFIPGPTGLDAGANPNLFLRQFLVK